MGASGGGRAEGRGGAEIRPPGDEARRCGRRRADAGRGKRRAGGSGKHRTAGCAVALRQIPEVSGALVAIDPHTGRVLAMIGGWSYEQSEFNRATQALRQPGSAFKPFVYLTALDNGFTPSTLVLDAPIVIDQGPGLPLWTPEQLRATTSSGRRRSERGLEKSRNLMTVRVAQAIGMNKVAEYAEELGVVDHMSRVLSMSLGAGETTPLRLTAAYAMIVNGGKQITPTLIDRVQDRHGQTLFRHDQRDCRDCKPAGLDRPASAAPSARYPRADRRSRHRLFQMVSMLQGVVAARHRGDGACKSASRSPARPARPTTATTPGSSASRPISRSASTSASTTAHARREGDRRRRRGADLPRFHDGGAGRAAGRRRSASPRASG